MKHGAENEYEEVTDQMNNLDGARARIVVRQSSKELETRRKRRSGKWGQRLPAFHEARRGGFYTNASRSL